MHNLIVRIPDSVQSKLDKRREEDSFRELMVFDGLVDFFSNDYLGLSKLKFSSDSYHGSTGSRLISGNSKSTEKLENKLAEFFNQETALLFNSGYDANLGFFSSVPQKGDTVVYDELCHASIRDGIRLGFARSYSFAHNNLAELNSRIEKATGNVYVVVESIYSMDGDESPLREISDICEAIGVFLVVDEAHSGGVYGEEGVGLVSQYDLDDKVFAKLITFGKAYGSHGAIILGSEMLKEYLINFARSFIYTTALSPQAQARIGFVVEEVTNMLDDKEKLKENIDLFKEEIKNSSLKLVRSNSPIQCLIIPGNKRVKAVAKKCLDEGFAIKAILSPTVSTGKERIRICIHSFNTKDEIRKLVQCLK